MAKYTRRKPKLSLVPKAPGVAALQGQVRGFCTTPVAKKALRDHGIPEKAIYLAGHGAEDMAACLRSYRERPGWLMLAQDLTAFGQTRRDVANRTDALEKAGIRLIDISHPQDQTYSAMMQRATVAINGARLRGDRKSARRQGRSGGLQKGTEAEIKRNEIVPAWVVDRIVDCQEIPWKTKRELLYPHITEATMRRHYGLAAALKRA